MLLRGVQLGGIIPIKKPFSRFAEQIFIPPGGADEKVFAVPSSWLSDFPLSTA